MGVSRQAQFLMLVTYPTHLAGRSCVLGSIQAVSLSHYNVAGGVMISRLKVWHRIVFSASVIAVTIGPSSAQRIQLPLIDIDCSAYLRRDDGKWAVLHRNKVALGSNVKKEVVPGDDPQTVELTPSSYLHSVLNATCGRLKKQ